MTAIAVAAFALCYAGVLAGIVDVWTTNYLYSYGFAVPLISGYMVWSRFEELRAVTRGPDYLLGLLVTGAGLALFLAGHLGALESAAEISLVVTLFGGTLLLFGRGVIRVAWFPIVYLLLAIPVWDRLISGLQVPSQLVSASISVKVLHLVGIPALQQHTHVILPNLTLDVLRECSGVNQLISVAVMALAAAYLWLKTYPRRIALMAIAVSVAYLSNGIRIALVGFLGYHGWSNGQVGTLHLLEGLAVSVVGYGLIFACLSLLTRVRRKGASSADQNRQASANDPKNSHPRVAWLDLAIVAVLLLAGVLRATFHPPAVLLNGEIHALPSQIENWVAVATTESQPGFRLAGADDELVRSYRHPSGETIRLYVGYHRYQTEGKELTDGASSAARGTASQVTRALKFETVQLNEIVQQEASRQADRLFWYDVNGRIVANLFLAKGYTIWDGLTRGRTNAAIVMIEWNGSRGPEFNQSRERVIAFADALVPLLRQYLPSENAQHAQLLSASAGVAR